MKKLRRFHAFDASHKHLRTQVFRHLRAGACLTARPLRPRGQRHKRTSHAQSVLGLLDAISAFGRERGAAAGANAGSRLEAQMATRMSRRTNAPARRGKAL